jgi:VacB/RNase II family 3'-5' exoribonuclease
MAHAQRITDPPPLSTGPPRNPWDTRKLAVAGEARRGVAQSVMKSVLDPQHSLGPGLSKIRAEFQVPESFPAPVLAAADRAMDRALTDHVDRTNLAFVTLDPASSTDLDQAFAIERSGQDLVLHYAIADVAWFVDDGDVIDTEAWTRGTTQYLPDGKAGLYPPCLSENVASLLPSGPRPAIIFTVRIAPDGAAVLDGAERATIQSQAKLAYDNVRDTDLPTGFEELALRIEAAETRRGASRVDPPEQEVAALDGGGFQLQFRPRLVSESRNAALSLAANLAIADVLQAHQTGLFRVMAEPDAAATKRLRHTALGLGVAWDDGVSLTQFERTLDAHNAQHAAVMLAIRRAGKGASYAPYHEGVVPWHAAMAATYAHATAPLRRLADRYVVRATLAIANGLPVPGAVTQAFARLPAVMAKAGARGGQIERAVIDLAEAAMLEDRVGEIFSAVATDVDERGVRIQLRDLPIVTRVTAHGIAPGDSFNVKLTSVDVDRRALVFESQNSA